MRHKALICPNLFRPYIGDSLRAFIGQVVTLHFYGRLIFNSTLYSTPNPLVLEQIQYLLLTGAHGRRKNDRCQRNCRANSHRIRETAFTHIRLSIPAARTPNRNFHKVIAPSRTYKSILVGYGNAAARCVVCICMGQTYIVQATIELSSDMTLAYNMPTHLST